MLYWLQYLTKIRWNFRLMFLDLKKDCKVKMEVKLTKISNEHTFDFPFTKDIEKTSKTVK